MYEQTKARILSPDCARWLESGRQALFQPINEQHKEESCT